MRTMHVMQAMNWAVSASFAQKFGGNPCILPNFNPKIAVETTAVKQAVRAQPWGVIAAKAAVAQAALAKATLARATEVKTVDVPMADADPVSANALLKQALAANAAAASALGATAGAQAMTATADHRKAGA
jgi:hypothetical protein